MSIPEQLRYTSSHEWVRIEGNKAYIGITDHAQESLGEIVYVELPEIGDNFTQGDELTTIESVKAASALYAPLTGKLVEVNTALEEDPALLNREPYEQFIFALEISDSSQIEGLLDATAYAELAALDE